MRVQPTGNSVTRPSISAVPMQDPSVFQMLHVLPCAVFTVDQEQKITFWNKEAERLTGYTSEEVMGQHCSVFALNPCNEGCQLLDPTRESPTYRTECEVRHKKGHLLKISKNAETLCDDSGNVVGGIESFFDVTGHKETLKKLSDSEARFRELFENMGSGVAVYEAIDNGADFVFVDFNRAGEKLENIKRESLIGKRVTEVFPGIDSFGLLDVFRQVFKTGEPREHPVSIYSDGRTPPTYRENFVYKLPSGNIVALYDDVTQQKEAEKELKKHREQLEELIEERTADLRLAKEKLESEIERREISEQKTQQSQTLLHTFLDHLPAVAFLKDMQGKVLLNNRELEEFVGVGPGQMLGKTVTDFFPPEFVNQQHRIEEKVIQTGQAQHYESEIQRGDKHSTKLGIKFPVLDEAGEITALGGLAIDITQQKRLEKELILKNLVFTNAIAANSIADPDGIITHVNPAFLRIWGYKSKKDAIGGSVGSFFVDPEEAGPVIEALNTKGTWSGEFLAKKKDGSTFISRGYATVIRNEKGETVGYQSANLDITAEHTAKKELTQSEARLRAIAQALPDLVFVLDEDGRYIEILTSNDQLLARQAETLRGQLMADVLSQAEADRFLEIVHNTLTENKTQICEYSLDVPAGTRLFEGRSAPMGITHEGKRIVVFVARDITERVDAERQIRELNISLEDRVRERTRLLEAANQELESFAYSVSHDLRAPLRSIDGFSRAVLEDYADRLDEQGKEFLERTCAASQRLSKLIDDLLELSRLTRKEFVLQDVNLTEIAHKILRELREAEPQREVIAKIQSELWVCGDRALLGVALANLVGNAWKFTSNIQEARIELGTRAEKDEQIFFVRDNGAGFDMEFKEKLFNPFQRLHGLKEFPGNGVGLATVKRVVTRHGGRVWAEGTPNQGATFYFTLPNTTTKE